MPQSTTVQSISNDDPVCIMKFLWNPCYTHLYSSVLYLKLHEFSLMQSPLHNANIVLICLIIIIIFGQKHWLECLELQLYSTELELVPAFGGFQETIHTFELYRGKKGEDDDDDLHRVVGKFKVRQINTHICNNTIFNQSKHRVSQVKHNRWTKLRNRTHPNCVMKIVFTS